MKYRETKPGIELQPFIHSFWELKGEESDGQWERNFPDGCAGLVLNIGDTCATDNGSVSMTFGKTYAVGAMTSFKDSFIDTNTHLLGVCLKPAAFANFYNYMAQNELADHTVEFGKSDALDIDRIRKDGYHYLNRYFTDRMTHKTSALQSVLLDVLQDIHLFNGQLSVFELAKRNCTTVRQLERLFKTRIGLSPKKYSNIVRFQRALSAIKNTESCLLDIAFEYGYFDHAHLTKEIKRNTGLVPSQL